MKFPSVTRRARGLFESIADSAALDIVRGLEESGRLGRSQGPWTGGAGI